MWDTDISRLTLEFLENIDPGYYEFIANSHIEAAIDEKCMSSSIAIRAAYSQGLETLFALISAAVQAPRCVPGWIVSYSNRDLYSVIRKINKQAPFKTKLVDDRISWKKLVDLIFSWVVFDDEDKAQWVRDGFVSLWSRFANDFLDEGFTGEYNSIKHGLRIKSGGFYLAFGIQEEPGIPAPKDKMRLMGKSDYGSSFLVPERIGGHNHHVRLKRQSRNWNPQDLGYGLQLLSMSIGNVLSALKIINGIPAEDVQFQWPSEKDTFSKPWEHLHKIGVTSMSGFQTIIPDDLITPFSKDDIKVMYQNGKDAGIKRYPVHSPEKSDTKDTAED